MSGPTASDPIAAGALARDEAGAGPVYRFARQYPLSLVGLGVLLYGTGPVLAKASEAPGPQFVFWRLWLGVVAFAFAAFAHVRWTGRAPSLRGWAWAARGGFAFGVHQLLFITAIKATTVVDVVLVGTLSPVVVGVMAVPLFGERPGTRFRLWSIVAMAGAAVVAIGGSTGPNGNPVGMTLALLNVVAFSTFYVWSKQAREHVDVIPFLFGTMVVAALTVTVFLVTVGGGIVLVSRGDLVLATALAFGPGFAGHFVMTWPLKFLPANVPPLFRLAVPFVAGLLAWVFLGEGVAWVHLAGGVVTLAGVFGAVRTYDGGGAGVAAIAEEPDGTG